MNELIQCHYCHDGLAPTRGHIHRESRAHYVCRECGRDVSQALFFIVDMEVRKAKQEGRL